MARKRKPAPLDDGTGWVSSPVADIKLPDQYHERSKMPKQRFESIKQALHDKVGVYDLTANQPARAILYLSSSIKIVI